NARIGQTGLPISYVATLWGSAAVAAALAWGAKLAVGPLHPIVLAAIVLGVYGVVFIGATIALRVPEARGAFARLKARAPFWRRNPLQEREASAERNPVSVTAAVCS